MRSEVLVIAEPGALPRIECRGGLAGRTTLPDTVHLVSTAATGLGGDFVGVRVVVAPGARLRLRSVAATIALPGLTSQDSCADFTFEVSGCLDVDLEPTIVAAGARHTSRVLAALDASGEFRLRERVQIGRTGEGQGFWSGSLHVDANGQPLLRHRLELGAGTVGDDVLAAPRACVSEFRYPGDAAAPTAPHSTVLELAGGGVLSTWQGSLLIPGS